MTPLIIISLQVSDAAGNVALAAFRLIKIVCSSGYYPCQTPDSLADVWVCGAYGVCGDMAVSNLSTTMLSTSTLAPIMLLLGQQVVYVNLGSGYDRYGVPRTFCYQADLPSNSNSRNAPDC